MLHPPITTSHPDNRAAEQGGGGSRKTDPNTNPNIAGPAKVTVAELAIIWQKQAVRLKRAHYEAK